MYRIEELSHENSKNEVLIKTNHLTELHIVVGKHNTVIKLPLGNSVDIIDGKIIIDND